MKNIVILGSTGSLGRQALEVAERYKKYFKIIAISANTNEKLLLNQAKKLHIRSQNTVLVSKKGKKNLKRLSQLKEADIIINVISGTAGIEATAESIKAGKTILLGNKESLIAAGKEIMELMKKHPLSSLIPLDSEHNAIYEILRKYPNEKIKKIFLPCSGGPFLKFKKKELNGITVKKALIHPIWAMGPKITIESATLINKGLEIIEAHYLFNLPLSKIDVFLHPEGQIHGIVEFWPEWEGEGISAKKSVRRFPRVASCGGKNHAETIHPAWRGEANIEDVSSNFYHPHDRTRGKESSLTVAYISPPDMREHIENALFRAINLPPPKRSIKKISTNKIKFIPPNHKTFPGIKIVTKAFKKFKNHPSKMTKFLSIEEKIINKFLRNKITFIQIFTLLEESL